VSLRYWARTGENAFKNGVGDIWILSGPFGLFRPSDPFSLLGPRMNCKGHGEIGETCETGEKDCPFAHLIICRGQKRNRNITDYCMRFVSG
jgi:hypothetical protein